jgi:predicted  nucleic acid-binding Zn-ribbon protein
MLTDKDIQKLTKYLLEVFKDVFLTKKDGEIIDRKLNMLQTSIDNISKDVRELKDEKLILNHRMKNTENWIDQASPKLGIEFKH